MVEQQVVSVYKLATAITLLVGLSKLLQGLRLRTHREQLEVLLPLVVDTALRQMGELAVACRSLAVTR
jgi:hypothetical protein